MLKLILLTQFNVGAILTTQESPTTQSHHSHDNPMHIITRKRLNEYAKKHPNATASLSAWYAVAHSSRWTSIAEVKQAFPHADAAQVASGRTIAIFNISGNNHRLITAIHYNTGKIFILNILTHAQYDKPNWKKEL